MGFLDETGLARVWSKVKNLDSFNVKSVNNTIPDENGNVNIDNGYVAYVTPEMFGAVGDGITDDTDAFLRMANSSRNLVIFGNKKKYRLSETIRYRGNVSVNNLDIVMDAKENLTTSQEYNVAFRFMGTDGERIHCALNGVSIESTRSYIPAINKANNVNRGLSSNVYLAYAHNADLYASDCIGTNVSMFNCYESNVYIVNSICNGCDIFCYTRQCYLRMNGCIAKMSGDNESIYYHFLYNEADSLDIISDCLVEAVCTTETPQWGDQIHCYTARGVASDPNAKCMINNLDFRGNGYFFTLFGITSASLELNNCLITCGYLTQSIDLGGVYHKPILNNCTIEQYIDQSKYQQSQTPYLTSVSNLRFVNCEINNRKMANITEYSYNSLFRGDVNELELENCTLNIMSRITAWNKGGYKIKQCTVTTYEKDVQLASAQEDYSTNFDCCTFKTDPTNTNAKITFGSGTQIKNIYFTNCVCNNVSSITSGTYFNATNRQTCYGDIKIINGDNITKWERFTA